MLDFIRHVWALKVWRHKHAGLSATALLRGNVAPCRAPVRQHAFQLSSHSPRRCRDTPQRVGGAGSPDWRVLWCKCSLLPIPLEHSTLGSGDLSAVPSSESEIAKKRAPWLPWLQHRETFAVCLRTEGRPGDAAACSHCRFMRHMRSTQNSPAVFSWLRCCCWWWWCLDLPWSRCFSVGLHRTRAPWTRWSPAGMKTEALDESQMFRMFWVSYFFTPIG